jgi:hypothetical protein
MMVELSADGMEDRPGEPGVPEVLIKEGALADEEKHGEPAEEIEGHQASLMRHGGGGRIFHGLTFSTVFLPAGYS